LRAHESLQFLPDHLLLDSLLQHLDILLFLQLLRHLELDLEVLHRLGLLSQVELFHQFLELDFLWEVGELHLVAEQPLPVRVPFSAEDAGFVLFSDFGEVSHLIGEELREVDPIVQILHRLSVGLRALVFLEEQFDHIPRREEAHDDQVDADIEPGDSDQDPPHRRPELCGDFGVEERVDDVAGQEDAELVHHFNVVLRRHLEGPAVREVREVDP